MGRQRISKDLKEMVVSMSLQGLPASQIHEYMGMSVRSIRRFRSTFHRTGSVVSQPSHGPAMAYISHGPANAESLSEFMGGRCRLMSEILAIFMGQPTSAESEKDVRHLFN